MGQRKLLFIHRSVGHHLIEQGRLRELLKDFAFDDYDNNSGILTQSDGSVVSDAITMPGNNTNPNNLADFFDGWPAILDGYDLIMIKSCYPNSRIKNQQQLAGIKESYNSIIRSFEERCKPLFILTSPPLRPLFTNSTETRLSGELADWLVNIAKGDVHVFDFHHLLAEPTGRHRGMLKREYRRLLPFDNHPNRKAHQVIAPQLAAALNVCYQ